MKLNLSLSSNVKRLPNGVVVTVTPKDGTSASFRDAKFDLPKLESVLGVLRSMPGKNIANSGFMAKDLNELKSIASDVYHSLPFTKEILAKLNPAFVKDYTRFASSLLDIQALK